MTLPFVNILDAPFHDPPRPLLRLDCTDPEEAERALSAAATFDLWFGYEVFEGPLTDAQTADPSFCFRISNVDRAPRTKPMLRSGLAAAAAACNLPAISRAADMEAELFVGNYPTTTGATCAAPRHGRHVPLPHAHDGLEPAATMFSVTGAEIKKNPSGGPAADQGGGGELCRASSMAEGTLPAYRAAQREFRQSLYQRVFYYTAREAKGNDHLDGTTGTYRGLDFDTRTMTVQISHDKLADDVRFAGILRRLRNSAFPFVPARAFESFVGRFGGLAQCDPQ